MGGDIRIHDQFALFLVPAREYVRVAEVERAGDAVEETLAALLS